MTGCLPTHYQQATTGYVPYNRVFEDAPSIPYQSYHQSSASTHLNSSYLFRDPKKYSSLEIEMITPKTARNRRKGPSGDQVKHRRTRSGCFTCRSRRVKVKEIDPARELNADLKQCDEARPICERCRKGSRECSYPDPTTSKSPGDAKGGRSKNPDEQGSSEDESGDDEEQDRLNRIDEDESQPDSIQNIRAGNSRNYTSSVTPSLITDHGLSPTPSTEGSAYNSTTSTISHIFGKGKQRGSDRAIPDDIKFYLKYFCDNITYHHFSLKMNADDVLQTTFLDIALSPGNEALLNALVGFSAYHYTLQNPHGKIQDFLQYYNKAVTLLLTALKKGEKASIGTLLCILQLAAIEEFLGDWVNLLGHQKAACALLTTIFTPQTISHQPIGRMILGWYTRFDLYGALIGGYRSTLPEAWIRYPHDYNVQMAQSVLTMKDVDESTFYRLKLNKVITELRTVSFELANLTSDMKKQRISLDQFFAEEKQLAVRIDAWESEMDPALLDTRFAVTDFTGAPPREPDDIVDPYEPGLLLRGELWPMNILRQDHLGVSIMLKYLNFNIAKAANLPSGKEGSPEHKALQDIAHRTCQFFEAIEYWPGSPQGGVIASQACLGIAPLLLPNEPKYINWFRKKMAVVECNGYIYAHTFRSNMAQIFGDPSVMDWWFPNYEGCPPVIRIIHDFVEERSAEPKDEMTAELKNMTQVFGRVSINSGDSSSSKSSSMEPGFEQDSPGLGIPSNFGSRENHT